ncbi:MAG: tetratricopeptide repeat protein [Croceibacterium sp.]
MTWVVAIAVALVAFVLGAFVFRANRAGWTTFAAALALGLAGYAFQASPDLPGAPSTAAPKDEQGSWALVDERKGMIGNKRSGSDKLIVADALARQGQYENAAVMLRGAVHDNPNDAEAWLALGNALVEHADGALTQPALIAYRRALTLDPTGVGPGYFLGLALIRQGQIPQARSVWADTLANAPEGADGRDVLAQRLGRLDALLRGEGSVAIPQPQTVPRQDVP